jgi:hypothetical protein
MERILRSAPGFEKVKGSGRLVFPAGDMFWVKTDAILPIDKVSYSRVKTWSNLLIGTYQSSFTRYYFWVLQLFLS